MYTIKAKPITAENFKITLPERIYKTDCVVVEYKPAQYVKIEL